MTEAYFGHLGYHLLALIYFYESTKFSYLTKIFSKFKKCLILSKNVHENIIPIIR